MKLSEYLRRTFRVGSISWRDHIADLIRTGRSLPDGLTIRQLEGSTNRAYREYRVGDTVQITKSPYDKTLRRGVGKVSEIYPTYIYVSQIRTRWKYTHSRRVFTADQLSLLGSEVNE